MNQLLKTLLDHPDKIERNLLWILQSSVIIWGLSVFFDLNILESTVNEPLQGNVFMHGLFFAHENEIKTSRLVGTRGNFYKHPPEPTEEEKNI